VLTLAGAPSSVTAPIKQNLTTGNTLLSNASKMTPATLATKTAALQSQHAIDVANQAATQRTSDVTELNTFKTAAQATIKPILANKGTSQATKTAANTLITNVNSAISTIQHTAFTRGSGSGTHPMIYTRPNVPTVATFTQQLTAVQDMYDADTNNTPAMLNRYGMYYWTTYVWPVIFIVTFFVCMVVGGIVASNSYLPVELYSPYNRAYYFIYGMLFFPIPMIMNIVKPTEWYATVCPLFSNDGTGPIVADDPPKPATTTSAIISGITSGLSSLTGRLFAGGATDSVVVVNPLSTAGAAAAPPAAVAPTGPTALKGPLYYYYPLVSNAKDKESLQSLSLYSLIFFGTYSVVGGLSSTFASMV
jgi:hypothetical protein